MSNPNAKPISEVISDIDLMKKLAEEVQDDFVDPASNYCAPDSWWELNQLIQELKA